jgi:hypothetical protein
MSGAEILYFKIFGSEFSSFDDLLDYAYICGAYDRNIDNILCFMDVVSIGPMPAEAMSVLLSEFDCGKRSAGIKAR